MTQFHVIDADRELQVYALARQPGSPRPAHPDLAARGLLEEARGRDRPLPHASAGRRPTRPLNEGRLDEAHVPLRLRAGLRRPREDHLRAAEDRRLGPVRGRHRDHRPRLAHDVAAHRPQAPDVRRGPGREVRRRHREGLPPGGRPRGRMQAKLPPDAVFMVMSDHGFHSFRRSVNLNTWLVQNGYMVFEGQESAKKGLADLFGRGKFWEGVDWSRDPRLRGGPRPDLLQPARPRVRRASSPRARSTRRSRTRSRRKLRARSWTPTPASRSCARSTGATTSTRASTSSTRPTCRSASTTATAWAGRTRWAAISRAVVENNNRKWSGDHCATATEISGGVFFANRRIATRRRRTSWTSRPRS